jgi:hypothetical protein
MATSFQVTIVDQATPRMQRYLAQARRINPRIGAAVKRLVSDHLFKRDATPNKNGWPSQHFYSNAAKATTWTANADGAIISINKQGFRQRLQGGVIKPVSSKYLTIPARAEAYGKRALEFGNLKFQWGKHRDGTIGPVALVADTGGATKKIFQGRQGVRKEVQVPGAEEGVVLYWLVKEARQEGDDSILPTGQEILDCAKYAIDDALTRLNN